MKVSRREFVGTAGCAAVASVFSLPSSAFAARNSEARSVGECTLLDLESNCALPESLAGMRTALGGAHRCVTGVALSGAGPVVAVPAAGSVRSETFGVVADLLEGGATVLWESGTAFLEPGEFARQRDLSREYFGILMGQPLDVWSQTSTRKLTGGAANQSPRSVRAIGHEQIPYVAYRWPCEARVRDFSRVIPMSADAGRAIAHWGKVSVAWSKSVGAGTLVYFGSPIGPALHAGDFEAHSLLRGLIAV